MTTNTTVIDHSSRRLVGHAVQPCRVGNLVTVGSSSGHCGDLPELSA